MNELQWTVDLWDEIVSDLSVFHRIDDPLSLPSSRFFLLAERLPVYGGAVAHAFTLMQQQADTANRQETSAFIGGRRDLPPGVVWVDDEGTSPHPTLAGSTLEAMQPDPGFPGIEFTG